MSGIGDSGPLGPSKALPGGKTNSLSDRETVSPENMTSDETDAEAARFAALLNRDPRGSGEGETTSSGEGNSQANDGNDTEDAVPAGPATAGLAPRTAAPPKTRLTMTVQTEVNAIESGTEQASSSSTTTSAPLGSERTEDTLAQGPAEGVLRRSRDQVAGDDRSSGGKDRTQATGESSSSDTSRVPLSGEDSSDRPIAGSTGTSQHAGSGDTGSDDQPSSQGDGDELAMASGLATTTDQPLVAGQTPTTVSGNEPPADREEVERLVATFVDSIRVSAAGEGNDRISITLAAPSRFAGASVEIQRADGGLTLSFENLSQDLATDLEGLRGQITDRLATRVDMPVTLSFNAAEADTARQAEMPAPTPDAPSGSGEQPQDGHSRNRREIVDDDEDDEDG